MPQDRIGSTFEKSGISREPESCPRNRDPDSRSNVSVFSMDYSGIHVFLKEFVRTDDQRCLVFDSFELPAQSVSTFGAEDHRFGRLEVILNLRSSRFHSLASKKETFRPYVAAGQ